MSRRRFSLLDAMLLIATTAVGVALARPLFSQTDFSTYSWITHPASKLLLKTWWCVQVTIPIPAVLTLAILVLRMRHPRPNFRRLMRQPGVLACLTWFVVASIRALGFLISALRSARAVPLMVLSEGWDSDTSWTISLNHLPAHQARGFIVGCIADTSIEGGLAVAAA